MSKRKKSKAVPVVIVITVLVAALCAGCFYAVDTISNYEKNTLAQKQAEVQQRNAAARDAYNAELAEYRVQSARQEAVSWPEVSGVGTEVLDLKDYPLENQTIVNMTRADTMNKGMLLVNQWHSRPDDFSETNLVGLGNYFKWAIQVDSASVSLFPVAADALKEAIDAAAAEGFTHYMVSEGYRSWDTQNTLFQNKKAKLASKYTDDAALLEATKKEVNYPGTSEYNTGLSFSLVLYDKNDASVGKPKYSTTDAGKWMSENCWKYGIVFRFPLEDWPLEGTMDKSFKTGVSTELNLYRYVGKGNAALMHALDFCLEEYVEYLQAHQHVALYEDGQLKYEVYLQYVGDASSFSVILTQNASSYISSMDNMGNIVTVFSY